MSPLDAFVIDSTKKYLQSVVFVDDKIYKEQWPKGIGAANFGSFSALKSQFHDGETEEIPFSGKREAEAASTTPSDEAKSPGDANGSKAPNDFHPRDIMESFAHHGIACALYEPKEGFKKDPESDLFRICEKADIIILDWDLHNDDGDGVSDLLTGLIKKSEQDLPHHVRLCTLYTDKPSLFPIMNLLFQKLEGHGCPIHIVEGKLQLRSGATQISIFGKPHSAGRPPQDEPYEVVESDLADRVISEFACLHHGLLPAVTLHGLAAIRKNTKRLLDRFEAKLDGAFLLHRILVRNDREAFEELPHLLSDEILAILEDLRIDTATLNTLADAAIDQLPLAPNWNKWTNNEGKPLPNQQEIFRNFLRNGEHQLREELAGCRQSSELGDKGFRGVKPKILKQFSEIVDTGTDACTEKLAALFCNRTHYNTDERRLSFGTVVRHKKQDKEQWEYSVCLMPICDSQRLPLSSKFPFWILKEDAKSGNNVKRNGIVIIDPENITHCLAAGGKIRQMLWLQAFEQDPGGVVIAKGDGSKFQFKTSDMIIEWVAELKPLHAQRIAAFMGSEISRVGLVESEWLRLFCDR